MENCQPSVVRQLAKEMKELFQRPPEGIRVVLNEANLTDIQAHIDGPVDTPYAGGRFHVRLVLAANYPCEPPKGFFVTKIFHPNVAPRTGEICVNTLKRDWTPDTGLRQLLLVIKCLLIVPNPESALNEEAGRLLLEEYTEYFARARLFTEIHAPKCGETDCGTILKDSVNDNNSDELPSGSSASAAAAAATSAAASGACAVDKKAAASASSVSAAASKNRAKKALKRL